MQMSPFKTKLSRKKEKALIKANTFCRGITYIIVCALKPTQIFLHHSISKVFELVYMRTQKLDLH